jgi:hypothetical protein
MRLYVRKECFSLQIFISSDRIYFCGKLNEVRHLLLQYISQYRTVKELINSLTLLNN